MPKKVEQSEVAKYLSRSYSRILIPQEGGGYSAEILEFPGCFSEGDSPEETYRNLERAAESWLLACLDSKTPIPEPLTDYEASGKYALRLPRSLYARAAKVAAKEGTSLNQFIVTAVAEALGARTVAAEVRAALGERVQTACGLPDLSRIGTAMANGQGQTPVPALTGKTAVN